LEHSILPNKKKMCWKNREIKRKSGLLAKALTETKLKSGQGKKKKGRDRVAHKCTRDLSSMAKKGRAAVRKRFQKRNNKPEIPLVGPPERGSNHQKSTSQKKRAGHTV